MVLFGVTLRVILRPWRALLYLAGLLIAFLSFSAAVWAQAQPNRFPQPQNPATAGQTPGPAQQVVPSIRPTYVLGSNDQILIRVPQSEEINDRPFRIDADGFINLPLVGRVKASGSTVQAVEADITEKLKQYIREPLVSITVVQFRSEPVFVMGEFKAPGIYPLEGRSLVEMLSTTGGLLPTASRRIKITRRSEYGRIPLPQAIEDADRKLSTVEISMTALSENLNPAEDIVLKPYDIVSVERAERIYISGEIHKPGPIEMGVRDTLPISQVLSEAGGFTPEASRNRVRVLRPITGTSKRAEIDVDLKRVFEGRDNDFPLLPGDVLFVPRATAKALLTPIGVSLIGGLPYIIISAILR
jgi:polysaccharide export outer membrane protein